MPVTLYLPTPLRKLTQGQARVQIEADTLAVLLERAEAQYPGFRERVLDTDGQPKRFINVFVNGVDVRRLQGQETPLRQGDEVSVVPAMAGGAGADPLVDVPWLQSHLSDKLRVIDARAFDPRLPVGYRMGHVPGAIPIDVGQDLYVQDGRRMQLKAPAQVAELLGARGIGPQDTIVIYDESTGPLGAFVYWTVKGLGHQDVRVLNGGWAAWKEAGAPVTKESVQLEPVSYLARPDPSFRATAEWIMQERGRPDVVLLDVRSDYEYEMGHIPGSVNLPFEDSVDLNSQQLKSPQELRAQFETQGVTPDREVVVYCMSGSRSAHTFMVLSTLGFPRVRNYDGSMMDWSHLRGLPLE